MKSLKFTISLILLLALSLGLYADHVKVNDAQTICKNYYWENSRTENPVAYNAIVPELFTTKTLNGNDLYYVFNINRNDGFVIIAADDDVTPVLGYSTTGSWTGQDMPPSLKMMLSAFADQITTVIGQRLDGGKEIAGQWEQYSKYNPAPPAPKAVTPLLSTTWDQNQYYNEQCPLDASGPGGHVYAGCVATSMAQVMNYWQHPTTGTGSNSYAHANYGTISANFGGTTYNYGLMPNSIVSSNFEIAQLIFHCGVSVNMNYGPSGSAPSGSNWDMDIENALKNNFNYSSTLSWKWKNNYSVNTWISMLKVELDLGRPLIYYGWDGGSSAHQFNCDGYNNNNYFHFNLGWSGYYDGYYAVTNLNPYYNFTYMQAAIFDMYPVTVTQNYDYGDAPDPSFPTTIASGGACHVVPANPSLFLGVLVDTEPDGQPHINCMGDDNDMLYPPANDDEDGVIFPPLAVGSSVSLNVNAFGTGLLQAWMDFNQDGDWADAGEQIFSNYPLSNGNNILPLNIPATAYVGWTYARFRYSSVQNLGYGGQAADGEVEDYFFRIEETLPEPERALLFSLDIGSDTELSDPVMDIDEVFDPGDAYLFQGAYIPLPGADGYFDDVQAFGTDPHPDGGVTGTGAPCVSGIPIDQVKHDYFDMDGIDLALCDLRDYDFGEGMPPIEKFDEPFIHFPDSLYISFDDDDAFPYTDPYGSIPRLGFSPGGMIYGQQQNKDEILEVVINMMSPPQAQVVSVNPKYDEVSIHASLTPDPTLASAIQNEHDDDVDALDAPYELNDAARTYFSADHEATFVDFAGLPLNPGSIYLAENGNAYEVINGQTDIGLFPDTDIDAFEFTWAIDPQHNYMALAMIFSVDDDDPSTPVDESGGMNPNELHLTFMTGWWIDLTQVGFEDDIDAITIFESPGSIQAPKADFSPLNSMIYTGQTIQFTDLSTDAPTTWTWTFNGGNPATFSGPIPPPVMYSNPGNYQVDLTVSNAVGTDTKSGTVKVLPANWQYTPTNLSHIIAIPLLANPTVNGNPLNNGDVIGVFYTDLAGNVMCGGYAIWDGINNTAVLAYADDPSTAGVKDGFITGEDFMWEVYSWSAGQSYAVSVTYDPTMPNFDGKYYDNGLSALTGLSSYLTHPINIYQGWSGLSSYLDPTDKNLNNLLTPILSDLELLMNFSGVYWPSAGVNTLGTWNPYDGYIVKVNQDVTLNITGSAITNRSLVLNPGWHIIPVLSSNNVSAASILGVPGVVIAKEIAGNKVYWPGLSIFTLNALETGKAYIILVNSTVTLNYPAKASATGPTPPVPVVKLPTSWNIIEPTPNTHIVAISENVCGALEKGDVIAAFNAQGINSGHTVYTGESIALAIFGDDQFTSEVDGMLEGEELYFRVYRQTTDEVFDLDVVFDPEMPNPGKVFSINGLSAMVLKTGVGELAGDVSFSVYPNPANHFLNIDLGGNNAGPFNLEVISSIGRNVYSAVLGSGPSARLDVSGWTEGFYFIRITNGQNTISKKIVIRK